MAGVLDPGLAILVRRVADDGRREPPALPVPVGRLTAWRWLPGARPGDPPRLGATCTGMEWQAGPEAVAVVVEQTAPAVLAALGHLVAGHACADYAPAAP